MIPLDYYVHSKRPYAVDLTSFTVWHEPSRPCGPGRREYRSREYWICYIDAVWFRGKVATPEACMGGIRWTTLFDPWSVPADRDDAALQAVAAHQDGRYGGDCRAKLRTDGTLWTGDRTSAAQAVEYENRLVPILANFPAVPSGWSGWWRFPVR